MHQAFALSHLCSEQLDVAYFWNKQNSANTICFWQNEQRSLEQKQYALKYLWKNNRSHKNITKAEFLFNAKNMDRKKCLCGI